MPEQLIQNENKAFAICVDFIESLAIQVHFKKSDTGCFLPGIRIENGQLLVDREKMKYPGDILHEAGHIAVIPPDDRPGLNADSIAKREQREAEEMMAIAWSYAACIHLNIDPGFVFHEHGYQGGGSNIGENFSKGNYFGVPMLQWTGMTNEKRNDLEPDLPVYPAMKYWMRQ